MIKKEIKLEVGILVISNSSYSSLTSEKIIGKIGYIDKIDITIDLKGGGNWRINKKFLDKCEEAYVVPLTSKELNKMCYEKNE